MIILGFIAVLLVALFFLVQGLVLLYASNAFGGKVSYIGFIPLVISGLLFYYLWINSPLTITIK